MSSGLLWAGLLQGLILRLLLLVRRMLSLLLLLLLLLAMLLFLLLLLLLFLRLQLLLYIRGHGGSCLLKARIVRVELVDVRLPVRADDRERPVVLRAVVREEA